jgi:hypothetical protein
MEFPFVDVPLSEVLSYYQKSKGYVKFNSGRNRRGVFVPSDELSGSLPSLGTNVNLGIGLGEYSVPRLGGVLDNLSSIHFFAIDIDFDFPKSPEEVILMLYSDLTSDMDGLSPIPFPTYVEYGHRIRLLYALSEPYILRTRGRHRRAAIRFCQKVIHCYAEVINGLNPHYHAEGQRLTTTFRPAGSINHKTTWNPTTERPDTICHVPVKMIRGGGKAMTMQDYSAFVMDSPKDHADKKAWKREHKRRVKVHVSSVRGGNHYLLDRVEALLRLQKDLSCIGMRETMCWNYHNLMLSLGKSDVEAYALLKKFNDNFRIPLPKNELRSARVKHVYHLSEQTFYAQFGMEKDNPTKDPDYHKAYSKAYRKEVKKNLEEKGQTKRQLREERKEKVQKLHSEGMGAKEIAKLLQISVRTVYYDLSRPVGSKTYDLKGEPVSVSEPAFEAVLPAPGLTEDTTLAEDTTLTKDMSMECSDSVPAPVDDSILLEIKKAFPKSVFYQALSRIGVDGLILYWKDYVPSESSGRVFHSRVPPGLDEVLVG